MHGQKSKQEFWQELHADKELDRRARAQLEGHYKTGLAIANKYNHILMLVAFTLNTLTDLVSIEEKELKRALERSSAELRELAIAIGAWGRFYSQERNITQFSESGYDPKDYALAVTAANIIKDFPKQHDTKNSNGYELECADEMVRIARHENMLNRTIPIILDAKASLQEARTVLQQFNNMLKDSSKTRYTQIMQNALSAMAEGYDELEIGKHFENFAARGR